MVYGRHFSVLACVALFHPFVLPARFLFSLQPLWTIDSCFFGLALVPDSDSQVTLGGVLCRSGLVLSSASCGAQAPRLSWSPGS